MAEADALWQPREMLHHCRVSMTKNCLPCCPHRWSTEAEDDYEEVSDGPEPERPDSPSDRAGAAQVGGLRTYALLGPSAARRVQKGGGAGVISCRFVLNSRPHHSGFYILGYIRVPDVLKLRYDEKATLVPWFQFIPRMLVRLQVLGSGVLRGLLGRGIVPYVR